MSLLTTIALLTLSNGTFAPDWEVTTPGDLIQRDLVPHWTSFEDRRQADLSALHFYIEGELGNPLGLTEMAVIVGPLEEITFPGESLLVSLYLWHENFDPVPVDSWHNFTGYHIDYDTLWTTTPLLTLTAIPVPAAVWLFGSALLLLGWVRRG